MSNRRDTKAPKPVVRTGHSYKDPVYDQYEAKMEKKHGVPPGTMRGIRTRGERSNRNEVSPVGARTVYQIMPETRRLFKKKYGIDAYASDEAAAEVATLHIKESMSRGNSVADSVREYHGGPDRSRWGPENAKYDQRVNGRSSGRANTQTHTASAPPPRDNFSAANMSMNEWMNLSANDIRDGTNAQVRPAGVKPDKPTRLDKRRADNTALIGKEAGTAPAELDRRGDLSVERATKDATEENVAELEAFSWSDRMGAAIDKNWVIPALARAYEEKEFKADPKYTQWYLKNWDEVNKFAQNTRESEQLMEANSFEELAAIQERITTHRERDRVINSSGRGVAFEMGAAVLDPVSWLATAGVTKLLQVGRVVGAGNIAVGAAEGAITNTAILAALDAGGEDITTTDYVLGGFLGLSIGGTVAGMAGPRGVPDVDGETLVRQLADHEQASYTAQVNAARTILGPDASEAQIAQHVDEARNRVAKSWLEHSLADLPAEQRLLVGNQEDMLTAGRAEREAAIKSGNLDLVSDDVERAIMVEMQERSRLFLEANPINDVRDGLNLLSKVDQESTGLAMLNSNSDVLKTFSLLTLESASGKGGRRQTAALTQATRERIYMRDIAHYESLFHFYRKSEGVGIAGAMNGDIKRSFDRAVWDEVEARGRTGQRRVTENPTIAGGADLWETGMNRMRVEQQHVGTIGSARLGTSSMGYMRHMMDPDKVRVLREANPEGYRVVINSLAANLREMNEYFVREGGEMVSKKFDEKFSQQLAKQYLETAFLKSKGTAPVPMNLHTTEAADVLKDALKAQGINDIDADDLIGKFSRGGASHTKQRLRMDMTTDLGNGQTLGDLFDHDVVGLYRGYARRVSGEVALAQNGILGKKGLDMVRRLAETQGATKAELRAFDQTAAEFLNTPYGGFNHKYLDNIRIATSLARLGGMGFTQAAETANGIAAVGISRVFGTIGAANRLRKEVGMLVKGGSSKNPILDDIDRLGGDIGTEGYQMTRMFDVKDNVFNDADMESLTLLDRGLRGAAHMQAIVSGHRMIQAVQVRGMSEQIVRKAFRYAKEGKMDKALADMGFDARLMAAMHKNMDKVAKFNAKGELTSLDLMKGDWAVGELRDITGVVQRGAKQIIQETFIGETGAWAHNGLVKMLAQFRTFGITSIEKQWGRNLKNYGAVQSMAIIVGAMSFSLPIAMARHHVRMAAMSRAQREQYAEKRLTPGALGREVVNYVSAAGLFGDMMDVSTGTLSNLGIIDDELAGTIGARGGGRGDIIGGAIAPGVGLLEDLVSMNPEKMVKAMPGANVPPVAAAIGGVFQKEE